MDDDYEILNTQPLYATVRTDLNTQPLYAIVRTDPNAQPLYATVRTGHRKKKIEETLKEDDYYEVVQQVREVMVAVVIHFSFCSFLSNGVFIYSFWIPSNKNNYKLYFCFVNQM